jgi:ribosomal protein S27AE
MGKLSARTDAHGVFRLYCGECGASVTCGGFDRSGTAILMLYLCLNCGEGEVFLRPHVWENVLEACLPPRFTSWKRPTFNEMLTSLADEVAHKLLERDRESWTGESWTPGSDTGPWTPERDSGSTDQRP